MIVTSINLSYDDIFKKLAMNDDGMRRFLTRNLMRVFINFICDVDDSMKVEGFFHKSRNPKRH